MRFKAHVVDYMSRVNILAYLPNSEGGISKVVKRVIMEVVQHEDRHYIGEPSMELEMQEAQSLLDALTEAGMRPTNLANPSGEIARITDHLQDMRRLVFKDAS